MAEKSCFTARVALATAVGAVFAFLLAAPLLDAQPQGGFLVSDQKRQCHPVPSNPGIGIAGYRYATECPDGYQVTPLPKPEQPWWIKLLDLLDRLFGLSNKFVWVFPLSKLASITAVVLVMKRVLQAIGLAVAGRWTWLVTAAVSFLMYIEPLLADGKLSVYELILSLLYAVFGSSVAWKTIRSAVTGRPLLKEIGGAFTGR